MNGLNPTQNPYAKALFDLGKEEGCLPLFQEQLEKIGLFLKKNPHIINQFSNPFLNSSHHLKALRPLIRASPPYLINFIKLLARNKRLSLLPTLIKTFDHLCKKAAGILTAQIQTASPLSSLEQTTLRRELAAFSKRSPTQISLCVTVDSALIAGLQIYMPPYFIDASLRTYLHKIDLIANDQLSP